MLLSLVHTGLEHENYTDRLYMPTNFHSRAVLPFKVLFTYQVH